MYILCMYDMKSKENYLSCGEALTILGHVFVYFLPLVWYFLYVLWTKMIDCFVCVMNQTWLVNEIQDLALKKGVSHGIKAILQNLDLM